MRDVVMRLGTIHDRAPCWRPMPVIMCEAGLPTTPTEPTQAVVFHDLARTYARRASAHR